MNAKNGKDFLKSVGEKAEQATNKAKDMVTKSKDAVTDALDINNDGKIDVEDLIIAALKTPGIKIYRDSFLRNQLLKNHSEEVITDAINYNPAHAGITIDEINTIADHVIQYERNCVSSISLALGMPGGIAMAATLPADIAQFYGYMLRAIQKLLYLYGYPEINIENGVNLDDETMNLIILCLGVMYGVKGASAALKVLSESLGKGVKNKLLKASLTKGTVYPMIKKIAKWFDVNLTKNIFADFFKKSIPVVGGVIGGGITYLSFKPCCDKLKEALQDTKLCSTEYYQHDIIDAVAE